MIIGKRRIAALLTVLLLIQSFSIGLGPLKMQQAYANTIASPNQTEPLEEKITTSTELLAPIDESKAAALTSSTPAVPIPGNLTVSASDTTIQVQWDAVAGAQSYDISLDGSVQNVTANHHIFSGLEPNSQYSIKVRAFNDSGSYGVIGDIDGDGLVNAIDFALLKKYLLTSEEALSEEELWTGDVNGDETISAIDIALMKKYLLDNSNRFPKSVSEWSEEVKCVTLSVTNDTPMPPTNIICSNKTDISAELSWTAPEGSSITGYDIFLEGNNLPVVSTMGETTCLINSLKPSTTYVFIIKTKYTNGSISDASKPFTVVTDKDTTAPSIPSAISVYSRHDTSLTIKWNPSVDNDTVAGYEIYRNGKKITTRNSLTYTDSGLTPSTQYNYAIIAYDKTGNKSGISSTLDITTLTNDDNENTLMNANPIDIGLQESSKINYDGDIDCFYFDTIWTGTYSIQSTGSTDMYAELYDSKGKLITSNNDLSPSDKNFFMKVNLTQYSKYYIKVKTNGTTGTGNYGLLVKLVSKVQTSSTSTVTASMGQKLSDLSAVTVNSKIYVMGGHNYLEGGTSDKIRVYDPLTEVWTTKTEVMPKPVWDYGMAAIGNKIYVAGGASKGCTNKAYEYDTETGTWQQKASLSKSRKGLGLVAVDGKLYAIGGTGSTENSNTVGYLGSVEVFDPANESEGWQSKAIMPMPRADFAAVSFESKIYIFGGHNKDGLPLNTVDVYDTVNNTWTTLQTKMPISRTGCKAVVRSGKINIIGGFGDKNNFLGDIDVFDPIAGTWSKEVNLQVPRMGMASVEANGSIYVMGGYNSEGCTQSVETIDLFKFKIKTTSSNEIYNFPIQSVSGAVDIVVNWGDGTTSTISTYSGRSHTYVTVGTYTIKVISFLQMPIAFSNDKKLIEVLTPIPNIGAYSFSDCFSECRNLTAIPAGLFGNNVNATDFGGCFYYCSSLTSIPAGLFDNNVNVTDFGWCFCYCRSLTSIPAGLFDNNVNVTDFSGCFYYCSSLTSIPAGLFDNNVNVTDFGGCFHYCSSLTSIPAGLFDNNVNVTDFCLCFYYCSSLTSIPAGLFDNNVKVTDFNSCFYYCSRLTSIPAGLFDNNVKVTDFNSCFYYCSSLTSIPSGLFDNNVKVTDFNSCFYYCSSLTSIPTGLFVNNVEVTTFEKCFSVCSRLKTIPVGLFDNNINVTDFYGCFRDCSSLTEIPAGLFDNNINATNFLLCFYKCSSLTEIPAGLFDNNVKVTNFNKCFSYCSSLAEIPAGLFDKNVNVTNFSECFSCCSRLAAIPAGLFDKNVSVTDFSACFSECISLTVIPAGLFDKNVNVTNFSTCFDYCSSLTSIPTELFDNNVNVTNFVWCFKNCSSLTAIPAGLFDKNVNVTNFNDCFGNCISLSTIPAGLFDNSINVTDFTSCFNNCSSLTAIPAVLFQNNVNVTNFDGCFYNCRNLTAIPAGLFDRNVKVTNFSKCFSYCSSLTAIPAGLFDNNIKVTHIYWCFSGCSRLTAIPAGLFDKNVNITDFLACFDYCSSLTAIPAGLFDNNVNVTRFSNCFSGCISLASIPAGLFDNNVNATQFASCFSNCNSLTEIPAGLFDNNVKVTNFGGCFYNCNKLTGLAPTLWLRSPQPSGEDCFYNCKLLSNYSSIPSSWI